MKNFIGKTLLALLLLASSPRALALDSFTLEMWDSERGLPNSTVTGIAQSPDGYLWISTINGLARFDGVRFVSFAGPTQAGLMLGPQRSYHFR
jgi:ligand-binding sensor domain-containing protein